MPRDYSKLEGKKIQYIHKNGWNCTALVVGCDPDIGITIVNAADHGQYLTCMRGPSSPKLCPSKRNKINAKKMFYAMAAAIRRGIYDVAYFEKVDGAILGNDGDCSHGVSADKCAFV